jgi:CheY-like chemotaxis protein/nitrogen-specific signal transduction histidine kinase
MGDRTIIAMLPEQNADGLPQLVHLERNPSDRAKDDFLSSINHEIRTPLNGILGHVDLMLDDSHLNPQHRYHAERIRAAGAALLGVANDVLNYAIADADRIRLHERPFDLRAAVEGAASIARHQAEIKGLAFECFLGPDLPSRLVGDQDRLKQVLMNLFGNAVRFTSHGRIRITIETIGRRGGEVDLRFCVSDTGIGIPAERQASLFDRSRVPDAQIRKQFGGAGFGLPVSKLLVEHMGGSITIESVHDLGSTVWFDVPFRLAPEIAETGPLLSPLVQRNRPARILLVEDNDINQEIARSILDAAGHEVDIACDGSVAVMAVQRKVYDLVLMDVQMPIMDGVSATRVIRSLSGPECDVPILAVTANVLPDQIRAFKEAGMNDHMGKPFQRDELLNLVDRWAFDAINVMIHSLSGLARARA